MVVLLVYWLVSCLFVSFLRLVKFTQHSLSLLSFIFEIFKRAQVQIIEIIVLIKMTKELSKYHNNRKTLNLLNNYNLHIAMPCNLS